MCKDKNKKIAGLINSLMQSAESLGRYQGLKSGLEGTGYFNCGVNPEAVIAKQHIEVEEIMNKIAALLKCPELEDHNYTPDPNYTEAE